MGGGLTARLLPLPHCALAGKELPSAGQNLKKYLNSIRSVHTVGLQKIATI